MSGVEGKRKRAGRRSNQQLALERMAMGTDPELVRGAIFPAAGAPYAIIEEAGVEAKLARIAECISGELQKVEASAATQSQAGRNLDEWPADLRPWATRVSPELQIKRLAAMSAMNEGIINALSAHLVEHLVIRADLAERTALAKEALASEGFINARYLSSFNQRLIAAGVTQDDIRYMSEARLAAVVEAITSKAGKSIRDAEALSDDELEIGEGEPGSIDAGATLTSDPREQAELDIEDASITCNPGEEPAMLMPSPEQPADRAGAVVQPVQDTGVNLRSATADVPDAEPASTTAQLPSEPGRWDVLELADLPYEIVQRPASEADEQALRMRLPPFASVQEMALPHGMERSMADSVDEYADSVENSCASGRRGTMSRCPRAKWTPGCFCSSPCAVRPWRRMPMAIGCSMASCYPGRKARLTCAKSGRDKPDRRDSP